MFLRATAALLLTTLTFGAAPASASPADDLQIVKSRFVASVLPESETGRAQIAAAASAAIQTQKPDGSWPDVGYTGTSTMTWEPRLHLYRLLVMAKAYRLDGQPWKGSGRMKQGVLSGINWWESHDYQSSNWWWNQIGVPQMLGETLLLMETEITPDQKSRGVEILKRSKWSPGAGENTVWPASNTVLRACLTGDPALAASAYQGIYGEIRVVSPKPEGLQADMSFHQHGHQFYSGSYGYAFGCDEGRFASFAWGTSFEIPPDRLDLLGRYLLDGQQWMVRGKTFDYAAIGREISRQGKAAVPPSWADGPVSPPVGAAYGLDNAVALLGALPVPRQDEYRAFAARMRDLPGATPFVGDKQFGDSDYHAHRRAGYLASVRMFSNRTVNAENTGGEGRYLHHIADGANWLYRTGNEYKDIFPLWDWEKVPGTTVERGLGFDPARVHVTTPAAFVGGVSDGVYGAAAMDVDRDDLTAHKAWFFFDDVYACLGAGITVTAPREAITTLDQRWWRGPVSVSGRTDPLPAGTQGLVNVSWVEHDGVSYIFPKPVTAWVDTRTKAGRWSSIGQGSTELVSGDVFALWLSHGEQPVDASYAYIVAPGADAAQARALAASLPVEIVANTKALQAVRSPSARVMQAVFWQPGEVSAGPGWTLRADQPCMVQMRETDAGVRLSVSNPKNAALTVNVRLDRRVGGPGAGPDPEHPGGAVVTFELPGDLTAGQSVTRDLAPASASALRVAGGLDAPDTARLADLDRSPLPVGNGMVDVADAVALARIP